MKLFFFAADYEARISYTVMENLMVIRVEVIAPEKPLLRKHLQK